LCVAVSACQATIGDPAESESAGGGADAGDNSDTDTDAPDAAAPVAEPDAAVPVAEPDAAVPVKSPEEQCAEQYGAVPGFTLCSAGESACTFIALIDAADATCGIHCAGAGGLCLSALDNDVGSCTDLEGDPTATCETIHKTDLLCTCTLSP
jgi:hypothetical protein